MYYRRLTYFKLTLLPPGFQVDLLRADPVRVLPLLLVAPYLPAVPRHDQGQAHAREPRRAGAADQPGVI